MFWNNVSIEIIQSKNIIFNKSILYKNEPNNAIKIAPLLKQVELNGASITDQGQETPQQTQEQFEPHTLVIQVRTLQRTHKPTNSYISSHCY